MDRSQPEYSHVRESFAFEPTVGYAALRERCPVHRVDEHDPPFYVVSRFADVVATLKADELWGNADGPGVFYQQGGTLGSADNPDHARHREVLRRSFSPAAIAALEPRITAAADELLDAMLPSRAADWVPAFAFPFPAMAIGELLGIPSEDRELFGRWTAATVAALTGGDLDAYHAARNSLADYVDDRLAEREAVLDAAPEADRADPLGRVIPDDVMSVLLLARRDGRLSPAEVRSLGHQLIVAGHETTTSLLGMMLYRLLERPAVMAALRADPGLIPTAVEEALRFDSPVNGLFRTNASACSMGGVDLAERTKLQVLYASANRDPAQFPEPDEFRLDRPRSELGRHVGFGWGIHFCIGAPLARMEARVAFTRLLQRTSDIHLAGEPVRNESFILHGLTSLPISWEPA